MRSSDLNLASEILRFNTLCATPFLAISLSLTAAVAALESEVVVLLGREEELDDEEGFGIVFLLKICLALTSAAAPNLACGLDSSADKIPETDSFAGELDLVDGRGTLGVEEPGPVRLSLDRVLPDPRSDRGRSFCQILSSLDIR